MKFIEGVIAVGIILFFGMSIGIIYAELNCEWFWQYPETGYYLVSEIDGEHEIRLDLYNLRSICSR
jgi:hypothetical protein